MVALDEIQLNCGDWLPWRQQIADADRYYSSHHLTTTPDTQENPPGVDPPRYVGLATVGTIM